MTPHFNYVILSSKIDIGSVNQFALSGSDDSSGRARSCGAEGESKSSQAEGPELDDTLQSARTHADGATGAFRESLRQITEAQGFQSELCALFMPICKPDGRNTAYRPF